KKYSKPMLLLHGKEDPLVPVAVAREHHRIVPQSSMMLYQADHNLLETHSDSLSSEIDSFISRAERGEAPHRADAPQDRLQEAAKSFSNIGFARFKGASLLILMLIIVFSTFFSEDLACIGAGLLAARGL